MSGKNPVSPIKPPLPERGGSATAGCDSNKTTLKEILQPDSDDSETEGADDVNEDSEVDLDDQACGAVSGDVDRTDCASASAHGDEEIDEDLGPSNAIVQNSVGKPTYRITHNRSKERDSR